MSAQSRARHRETRRSRRAYRSTHHHVNRVFGELLLTPEPHDRAELLDRLAGAYQLMSEIHDQAWGQRTASNGVSAADALATRAALVRCIERSERSWGQEPGPTPADDEITISAAWLALKRSTDRRDRSELLKHIYDMSHEDSGHDAVGVLLTIANTEQEAAKRSGGEDRRLRQRREIWQQLVPTPAFVWALAAIFLPILAISPRAALLACGIPAAYNLWWVHAERYYDLPCDADLHWKGDVPPPELAEYCPACDPRQTPIVDAAMLYDLRAAVTRRLRRRRRDGSGGDRRD